MLSIYKLNYIKNKTIIMFIRKYFIKCLPSEKRDIIMMTIV